MPCRGHATNTELSNANKLLFTYEIYFRLQRIRTETVDKIAISITIDTVDGESYAWEKVHEFHEFRHSRETFPLVHFKFHWNQQCIVGIMKLFHWYAK